MYRQISSISKDGTNQNGFPIKNTMTHQSMTQNTLFHGDNLPILPDYISTESVDPIYLFYRLIGLSLR